MGPLLNGLIKWLVHGGDPNYLMSGMILQAGSFWILFVDVCLFFLGGGGACFLLEGI